MKTTLGLAALLVTSATAVQATEVNGQEYTKQIEKKMLKSVSVDMGKIMEKLESDWDFIGNFLDNPETTIANYDLTDAEKEALTTRDLNGLMKLGISEEEVSVAMSGTHRGGHVRERN